MISHHKSDLLEINIGLFAQKTTSSTAQFLKAIFEIQRFNDILFR